MLATPFDDSQFRSPKRLIPGQSLGLFLPFRLPATSFVGPVPTGRLSLLLAGEPALLLYYPTPHGLWVPLEIEPIKRVLKSRSDRQFGRVFGRPLLAIGITAAGCLLSRATTLGDRRPLWSFVGPVPTGRLHFVRAGESAFCFGPVNRPCFSFGRWNRPYARFGVPGLGCT